MLNDSKKTLFIIGTDWASGYYRMRQPATALMHKGYHADCVIFRHVDPYSLLAHIPQPRSDPKTVDITKYDNVIFQLVFQDELVMAIQKLSILGVKTAMEIDDDYFSLPADNPSWLSFHPKIELIPVKGGYSHLKHKTKINNKIDIMKEACKLVDLVQVSTPELGEVYSKLNSNVVVLENCVENDLYDVLEKRQNEKPVIGWFGTRTHLSDLRLVLGCFPPKDKFKLLLAGWPESREMLFKDFSDDEVEVIPTYNIDALPEIIKKCDIGIVPLVDCRFNDGKSDLKGVEFGASGVPVIASDVAPYRRWIRHGENGLLAKKNKTKFWIRYMRQLVEDESYRKQLSNEAKKDAVKRDIKSYVNKWIEAYYE